MKKSIFFSFGFLILTGLGLLVLDACKLKNPTEGVKVFVKADALSAPFEFYIVDAATGTQADLGVNYEVKVTGRDAAYVYTSGGSKKLIVNQGLLQFAFRKGMEPSESNPFQFNFEFTGTKYQDLIFPVEISSMDELNTVISLIDFNNPPSGSASISKTITTGTDGKTTTDENIVIGSSTNKPDVAKILIQSGTQLLDANGNPVTGNIEAKIIHSNPTENSLNGFPGGLELNELKDKTGNLIEGGDIEPIGWIDYEMKVGNTMVKSFSKPVEVTMEISDSLINPETEMPYQVGDVLTILSLSAGNNVWVKEGEATITKNSVSDKLEVLMPVSHLSKWTVTFIKKKCGEKFSIKTTNSSSKKIKVSLQVYLAGKNNKVLSQSYKIAGNKKNYTIKTSFKPSANVRYDLKIKNKTKTKTYKNLLLCNAPPFDYPEENPGANESQFNIVIQCPNGNQVLLTDGYPVYYIKESDYQANIVPANGNTSAHKIDPSDGEFNGVTWVKGFVNYLAPEDGTEALNSMNFTDGELVEGERYRFSVYYNGEREDFVSDPYNKIAMDLPEGFAITIKIRECPF
jgi:hypothetical protein